MSRGRRPDAFIIDSSKYHGTLTAAVKNVLDAVHIMGGIDCTYPPICARSRWVLASFGGPSTPDVIDALYHARGARHARAGGADDIPDRRSQIEVTGSDGRIINPASPGPGPTQAMFEEVSEIEIAELLHVRNLATTVI